ncbi:MAG: acetylxylan esterase [Planctomycetaceae bacterium]|nr:acetylxylan esterase [Planctomycetaceae bacterium]
MRLLSLTVGLPVWFWSVLAACVVLPTSVVAQTADPPHEFLSFIQTSARELRSADRSPADLASWQKQRQQLRDQLEAAWGGFPNEHAPLEPQTHDILQRDGYDVEKLTFQTFPGVRMTANLYRPHSPGRHPAVLCVHGHWRGAKQDPHVQARCLGLVKLGFVVLAVDAFGAGERAITPELGQYHGEMVAATLWPIGRPLSGLQVYENMRAVDYLISRPDVDARRLGITGASGGGNQTMYAGAWDERFSAVVPVCSVGNYQAYLGAACCMCEVVPGALQFTEEWGVLSLTAPRALMVISATRDAFQFSVNEARKSIAMTQPVYGLFDRPAALRHATFESQHDYNQPMREAMYGWMTLHLKEQGDGSPIPEPDHQTEDPEALRCFPGTSRPADWVTIPMFAAAEGQKLMANRSPATPRKPADLPKRRKQLRDLLNIPNSSTNRSFDNLNVRRTVVSEAAGIRHEAVIFEPEEGVILNATVRTPVDGPVTATEIRVTATVPTSGRESIEPHVPSEETVRNGLQIIVLPVRATGQKAWPRDQVGRAPDHNSAEWSLWLGRPLLGQWVMDVQCGITACCGADSDGDLIRVVADGPASMMALTTAALDDRIDECRVTGLLASWISAEPYENQRLGLLVPSILRDFGDVDQIAAMIAPRRLVIRRPVLGNGDQLTEDQRHTLFAETIMTWSSTAAGESQLTIVGSDAEE